jgi:ATP adenylyltransferase
MEKRPIGMECLWAPWRMEFIRDVSRQEDSGECFLCRAAAADDLAACLVVKRTPLAMAVLNRYPYNNGHLLIAPLRHVAQLEELEREEMAEISDLLIQAKKLMDYLMTPHGYNIGLNLGRAAGAGLEAHLHVHIVPRWVGDVNFMTTVGSAKVIPQSLEELWRLLSEAWSQENPPCLPEK